jgi:hypothetical protein
MRNPRIGVIDDDREHIRVNAVAPLEQNVAAGCGDVLAKVSLNTIDEVDLPRFHAQAAARRNARQSRPLAAGAWIALFLGEILATATALEQQPVLLQPLECRGVCVLTRALADDGAVPFESEGLERREDGVSGARDLARPIKVLDAQQPAAAVGACIEVAGDRRVERA